jgi:MOSC domain-containing protein YiiM
MQVLSLNVGEPRLVSVPHGSVLTAIFKTPVPGRRAIERNNLVGDRQADLRVHGGPYKAVYAYPSEHYRYWAEQLPDVELPFGSFGENLTTEGLLEEDVCIGDRFRIGSSILQVTQPRMPCYKLAIRLDRPDMVKLFWRSGRSGFYLSVVEAGEIGAGDRIEKLQAGPESVSVADVVRLYKGDEKDKAKLERALRSPLHGGWKEDLEMRRSV